MLAGDESMHTLFAWTRDRGVLLCTLVAWYAGCSLTPQKVEIQPQLQVAQTVPVSEGQEVSIVVVDLRPSGIIGNRGLTGTNHGGANLTSTGDVAETVKTAARTGLGNQGFKVIDTERASYGRQLRVEIVNLSYSVVPGIITGTLRSESALRGQCIDDKVPQYDRVHRGISEEQVFFSQFAGENATHINTAMSDALNALLGDIELISCLTGN